MSARNRFFILLGIIFVIAAGYYYFSTNHTNDLVLIGTVDANQVIVSAQVEGRIQKLLVDEGTPVKAGAGSGSQCDDCQPATQSCRDEAYRGLDHRLDLERRRQCTSQSLLGQSPVDAGPSHAGTNTK